MPLRLFTSVITSPQRAQILLTVSDVIVVGMDALGYIVTGFVVLVCFLFALPIVVQGIAGYLPAPVREARKLPHEKADLKPEEAHIKERAALIHAAEAAQDRPPSEWKVIAMFGIEPPEGRCFCGKPLCRRRERHEACTACLIYTAFAFVGFRTIFCDELGVFKGITSIFRWMSLVEACVCGVTWACLSLWNMPKEDAIHDEIRENARQERRSTMNRTAKRADDRRHAKSKKKH